MRLIKARGAAAGLVLLMAAAVAVTRLLPRTPPVQPTVASATATARQAAAPTAAGTPTTLPSPTASPTTAATAQPAATRAPTLQPTLSAEQWQDWPVMPVVSEDMVRLYRQGVAENMTNPYAFSVFGDCQSESYAFLGVYDTDILRVRALDENLQQTVANFRGSFSRFNPAAKNGSSAGSLLYAPWNDNLDGKCVDQETPVDCELRTQRPSIVLIQLGTHYETPERFLKYMGIIIEKVLWWKAVPVLVTKADNLEGDGHVNRDIVSLAQKYGLPVWNFWASVQPLPDKGLQENGMHLTEEAAALHQLEALRVLDLVWRAVR